ncbi:MAG: hypothetical protein G3M70_04830 [Candidatus Nitronauta litoralis]|uniref:Uncharacterized protein n=1 Tax=Candidatus Nitronauta litoralis TaxID=2705533 RepID=A0A7T0BUH1_9BACT|nr:MAG: hypothetical protein G3M70_04830 [Candidatus Nitronauta litoralis]
MSCIKFQARLHKKLLPLVVGAGCRMRLTVLVLEISYARLVDDIANR